MKLIRKEDSTFVRLQFGYKSLTFEDTTVGEIYDLMIKVFSTVKVNKTVELENHNPLEKPESRLTLGVTVREEGVKFRDTGCKGKAKYKTLYGLKDEEALNIFKDYLTNNGIG